MNVFHDRMFVESDLVSTMDPLVYVGLLLRLVYQPWCVVPIYGASVKPSAHCLVLSSTDRLLHIQCSECSTVELMEIRLAFLKPDLYWDYWSYVCMAYLSKLEGNAAAATLNHFVNSAFASLWFRCFAPETSFCIMSCANEAKTSLKSRLWQREKLFIYKAIVVID